MITLYILNFCKQVFNFSLKTISKLGLTTCKIIIKQN